MTGNNNIYSEDQTSSFTFSDVFQLINNVSTKYKQIQKQEIKNLMPDISITQFMILRHLWKSEKAQFKIIAKACNCPPSTLTGIVDSLENNELVSREQNPKDRRSIMLVITDKGKLLQESAAPLEESLNTCCTGFTEEELQKLGYLLKKLNETLEL